MLGHAAYRLVSWMAGPAGGVSADRSGSRQQVCVPLGAAIALKPFWTARHWLEPAP